MSRHSGKCPSSSVATYKSHSSLSGRNAVGNHIGISRPCRRFDIANLRLCRSGNEKEGDQKSQRGRVDQHAGCIVANRRRDDKETVRSQVRDFVIPIFSRENLLSAFYCLPGIVLRSGKKVIAIRYYLQYQDANLCTLSFTNQSWGWAVRTADDSHSDHRKMEAHDLIMRLSDYFYAAVPSVCITIPATCVMYDITVLQGIDKLTVGIIHVSGLICQTLPVQKRIWHLSRQLDAI